MIELRVGDARQRDVARGIGRIDHSAMQELGISSGDIVKIVGKRSTAVIAWPAYSEDQDKEIIRIDELTRKNADAELNGIVIIQPAEVKDAKSIVLSPVDMQLLVDDDFTKFVKNRLNQRVFVQGDKTIVMMLGHPVQFMVTSTVPEGIVKMTYDTELHIERGPSDKEVLDLHAAPKSLRALRSLVVEKRDNTVMTRLSDEDLEQIDILIGIGLFDSRSEAVAYLTHEGIVSKKEMFDQLSQKFEQIKKVREEAKALLGKGY